MAMELCHIWLARFPSESAFDEYFDENYEDDDAPINSFSKEQGQTFYDHDWLERSFKSSGDLRQLIQGHSYADSYSEKVIAEAASRNIKNANCFIMADSAEFHTPRSISSASHEIWYLGTCKCDV